MEKVTNVDVASLSLDLENYRVPKKTAEGLELKALIAENPKAFWALVESLIDLSLLPTENFIVLRSDDKMIVKEGNRRISALKLILGQLPLKGIDVPANIQSKIKSLKPGEISQLSTAPCVVFEESQRAKVQRIVELIHAKGQAAARLDWSSVGRARWARDHNTPQLGLDLLEHYLEHGENITSEQRAAWGGNYYISVLDDALPRIAKRLEMTPADLVKAYVDDAMPRKLRSSLERALNDIGLNALNFDTLRSTTADALHDTYGFPARPAPPSPNPNPTNNGKPAGKGSTSKTGKKGSTTKTPTKGTTQSLTDPRSVRAALRSLVINGADKAKVLDLRDEAVLLDIAKTPFAFCFVLRSMFEISGNAYCKSHKIPMKDVNKNRELTLAEKLKAAQKDLVSKAAEPTKMKQHLHGSEIELNTPNRWLSVTSLNQLVHHQTFSVAPGDICSSFHNVFPLLQGLNS